MLLLLCAANNYIQLAIIGTIPHTRHLDQQIQIKRINSKAIHKNVHVPNINLLIKSWLINSANEVFANKKGCLSVVEYSLSRPLVVKTRVVAGGRNSCSKHLILKT